MTILNRETMFQYARTHGYPAMDTGEADAYGRWFGIRNGYAELIDLDAVCVAFDGPGSVAVGGVCQPGVRPPAAYAPTVACPSGQSLGWILQERSNAVEFQCGSSVARITPGDRSKPCPPGMQTVDYGAGLRYCRPVSMAAASNTAAPLRCPRGTTTMPDGQCVPDEQVVLPSIYGGYVTGDGRPILRTPRYTPPPPISNYTSPPPISNYTSPPPPISNYTPPPPPLSNYTPPPPPISNYTSPPNYTPPSAVVSRIEEWTIFGFPGLYVVIGGIAGLFMFSNKKG